MAIKKRRSILDGMTIKEQIEVRRLAREMHKPAEPVKEPPLTESELRAMHGDR